MIHLARGGQVGERWHIDKRARIPRRVHGQWLERHPCLSCDLPQRRRAFGPYPWRQTPCPHKKKDCWRDTLAAARLDDIRLASKLNELLDAKKTEFYKGRVAADCTDNATQLRAAELLAELLGRKKLDLNLVTDLPQVVMQLHPDAKRDCRETDSGDDGADGQ